MLRPRESRDLRLISSALTVARLAQVAWAHGVFGNSIATAMFQGATNNLVIDSVVELQLFGGRRTPGGRCSYRGAGWISFDPTNRGVGGFNLIPVAVGRDMGQVMPVAGSFVGNSDAFAGMTIKVRVTASPYNNPRSDLEPR